MLGIRSLPNLVAVSPAPLSRRACDVSQPSGKADDNTRLARMSKTAAEAGGMTMLNVDGHDETVRSLRHCLRFRDIAKSRQVAETSRFCQFPQRACRSKLRDRANARPGRAKKRFVGGGGVGGLASRRR